MPLPSQRIGSDFPWKFLGGQGVLAIALLGRYLQTMRVLNGEIVLKVPRRYAVLSCP